MSFATRMTRSPRPFDTDLGRDALVAVPGLAPELSELVTGAAGSSPYLCGLIVKEAAWLEEAFGDPEAALATVLAGVAALQGEVADPLRQAKRRVALLAALADLAGVWPLETVTGALTDLADAATAAALHHGLAREVKRKKLEARYADPTPVAVLAMGKMGAHELNYSSDIDLICLFDETALDASDTGEARAAFVRATRTMAQTLSEITAEGYVFRTDLRLRPDAAVTPVCLSMAAAERYYESVGRTWERAAYIKARVCAGDQEAGARFLETLTPFVWRKHLDFAAIQDAHDMRLKIRAHKGLGGRIVLTGHDMKLGRGGIREIEFFTQTRQLIAGGRDPSLRVRGTVEGLARLAAAGWVPEETAQRLTEHYRAHREVEHRVQMIADQQTHLLPGNDEGFERLAALMGRELSALKDDLRARLAEVHELTEDFFAPRATDTPQSDFGAETVAGWYSYPALRSSRAVEIFDRLKPGILRRLEEAGRPEEALDAFDGFLRGLPAGVQLFSLFDANPQLVDLIVDISATSAPLAKYLARNAGVFDAVIGGSFFAPWPGVAALTGELTDRLSQEDDYENQLDSARRWSKEWHFRIGVHLLRGLSGAEEAGRHYADLAEAVLAALWPPVVAAFAAKHGDPPGRGAVVLGMGSLGAGRLHAGSDLDLILIYDADGVDGSDGRRPLASQTYYARLTQAFITALTAPMAEGRLYETDMRLRPSGRHGPVATALSAFISYQETEAWTWEHLALTRARAVAGSAALGDDVEAFRGRLLARPRDPAKVVADVAEMRARIAQAKGGGGPWEAKIGPGRVQDIELLGQAAALLAGSPAQRTAEQIAAGVDIGWLSGADGAELAAAYDLGVTIQAVLRLIEDDAAEAGPARALMLRATGAETPEALQADAALLAARADEIITAALGTPPGEDVT